MKINIQTRFALQENIYREQDYSELKNTTLASYYVKYSFNWMLRQLLHNFVNTNVFQYTPKN